MALSVSGIAQQREGDAERVGNQYAIAAGILGWTLDAYNFFVLIFIVDILAVRFAVSKSAIILTLGFTLALRPVGALAFGTLADRYSRRKSLILVIICFSALGLLSGLSTNYVTFLVLRALYGIGMGGFWGVGASFTMEASTTKLRGLYSGLLQAGYPLGNLLAAIAARTLLPLWGWRAMFWSALFPALITIYAAYRAPESASWKEHHVSSLGQIFQSVWDHRRAFLYLVFTLSLMVCLAHGTQDLYPDFLKSVHNFSPNVVSNLAMIYSIGGICGTISGGHISERVGRRRGIIVALALCLLVIPAWAFGQSAVVLTIAAVLMQVGVQAAWGVIPAHLNELSPNVIRSLFAGLVYQLGVLFASPTNSIEYALRGIMGYKWAIATFEAAILVMLIFLFAFGPERKGRSFNNEAREVGLAGPE
jgi:SHS family lactate transporter-like MFS transporter